MMHIYLYSAGHISNQNPLSDEWFTEPIIYNKRYTRSLEPDFSAYIPPALSRRMGKALKRALVTALHVVRQTGIDKPDAIITGTGLGCVENTEKFLTAMLDNNEQLLPPTCFMQSTHNTISSQIAVYLKCNTYNSTYSHRGTSFDSALFDACMQFELGEISTALVGGHDELTPDYFRLLDKISYWKEGEISEKILREGNTEGSFAGECSVSFMLGNKSRRDALCEIKNVELLYNPSERQLSQAIQDILQSNRLRLQDIDMMLAGINGDKDNDSIYKDLHTAFFPDKPLLWYKHIFGEAYTTSGLGLYVAATILQKASLPRHLVYNVGAKTSRFNNILLCNHFRNKDYSLILLSSCLD
ncbi:MAG: beta-ketoacyl synthase chain length factor [Bacteroidales bacterium]|jgi:3-oxoacyl-(acyl-carrier-protein) synthase|nr:beta-ketoacyl synthase chain length factor [Bacteroidales bacterium]